MIPTPKAVSYFICSTILLLISCVSQKKIIAEWERLRNKEALLAGREKSLTDLNTELTQKAMLNEIDDSSAAKIKRIIGISKAELDKLQAQNEILTGKTSVSKADWPEIRKSLELTDELLKSTADKLALINDLLSRPLVIRIDQDIIFEPGQYKVSASQALNMPRVFEPAANEIDAFIKKYPDFDLSLIVNANGFADATAIAEGSALYRDLKARVNSPAASGRELNKELSRLRAEEVIELFKKYYSSRPRPGKNVKNIIFSFEGKGDELPNPRASDYKTDDPRRRVVLLFWSVFPE
jgi:flagellar motor protein MotB